MLEAFTNSSLVGLLSMLVTLLPLGAGLAYAARPSEQRLALMRPLSLAAIFAGLCGSLVGAINILRYVAVREPPVPLNGIVVGSAEALVPLVVAFGSLTATWLCAALGLRRHG